MLLCHSIIAESWLWFFLVIRFRPPKAPGQTNDLPIHNDRHAGAQGHVGAQKEIAKK